MKALVSLISKSKVNFSLRIFREESADSPVLSCNSVTYFSILPLNNLKIEISHMKSYVGGNYLMQLLMQKMDPMLFEIGSY